MTVFMKQKLESHHMFSNYKAFRYPITLNIIYDESAVCYKLLYALVLLYWCVAVCYFFNVFFIQNYSKNILELLCLMS